LPLLKSERANSEIVTGELPVAYFSTNQSGIERGCKVIADIACATLLSVLTIAFFGILGGLVAFLILEGALLAVDYVVPSDDDAASVVR
jgi:hypothetical protein